MRPCTTDLELLWQALSDMFEHDRSAARGQMASAASTIPNVSAARGEMSTRGLYVFEHAGELGNAHSHVLFDRLAVSRQGDAGAPARDFGAYSVAFDGKTLAVGDSVAATLGVTLTRRC